MSFFAKSVTTRILTNISFLNKIPLIAAKRGYETKLEKEWILQNNIKIKEAIKGSVSIRRNFFFIIFTQTLFII
jgi:hypothetical protein